MTALHCAPHNILVPVRDYNTLTHLDWVVSRPETENRDIVVVTLRLLRGPGAGAGNQLSEDELFTDYEQLLFTRVVAVAERCGRNVKLLVAPATNFFDAIVQTAGQLRSDEIVIGESAKMPADQQALLIGDAWDRTPHPRELTTRLVLHCYDGSVRQYSLGAHVPELSPQDVDRIHRLWTEAVKEIGPAVHHRDIVSAALSALEDGMTGEQRAAAIDRLRRQVNSEP